MADNETPFAKPAPQRRRRYDRAFKRALVEQTQAPGASVARIAREHGINANQLFKWRREVLGAEPVGAASAGHATSGMSLVPVTLLGQQAPADAPRPSGTLEVVLRAATVRIHGAVDPAMLEAVLARLAR